MHPLAHNSCCGVLLTADEEGELGELPSRISVGRPHSPTGSSQEDSDESAQRLSHHQVCPPTLTVISYASNHHCVSSYS